MREHLRGLTSHQSGEDREAPSDSTEVPPAKHNRRRCLMPWFRVDDGFMQHAKVLAIPKRDRLSCVGLWMAAGTWSARNLSDGKVPFHVLDEIGGTTRLAGELVKVSLWRKLKTGYVFINWSEFQPTRSDVMADREAAKERMRKAREARRGTGSVRESSPKRAAESDVSAGQDTNGSAEHFRTGQDRSLTPTRPDPTRPDPIKNPPHLLAVPHQDAAPARKVRGMNVGGQWITSPAVCVVHDENKTDQGTCLGCESDKKAASA